MAQPKLRRKVRTQYGNPNFTSTAVINFEVKLDAGNSYFVTAMWDGKTVVHRTIKTFTLDVASEVMNKVADRVKIADFPWKRTDGSQAWDEMDDHGIDIL